MQVLESLFQVLGTQDTPVVGLTIANLTFRHTAETFLKPHMVPSGGDYAIHRK